jgi:hypothetical protein
MVQSKSGLEDSYMSNFESTVFINCPFDKDYDKLLKIIIFSLIKFGLEPTTALNRFDSGQVRYEKIKTLILGAKFSIHDLSRSKSSKEDEFYRLNMPFELGLDIGCRDFHFEDQYRNKKILILEEEEHNTKIALSDVAFGDHKAHNGNGLKLIFSLREWLIQSGINRLIPATKLWDNFNYFYSNLAETKSSLGFAQKDIDNISVPEFIDFAKEYELVE